MGTIAKRIGELWGKLSPEEKEKYQSKAREEKGRVGGLVRERAGLHRSPSVLAATGVGQLVEERGLWGLAGVSTQRVAQA